MKFLFRLSLLLALVVARAAAQKEDESAAALLFVRSDVSSALRASELAIQRQPTEIKARFVQMEAARLRLRTQEELQAALWLVGSSHSNDARAQLAAQRIRELAANTPEFRNAVPAINRLVTARSPQARVLIEALLKAQADGAPVSIQQSSVKLLINWRIAGPFSPYENLDFDRTFAAERDGLRGTRSAGHAVEEVQSDDGQVVLPDYFPSKGIYYVATRFVTRGERTRITVEDEQSYCLFVDGKPLLTHDVRERKGKSVVEQTVALPAGSHRVLLKLQGAAFPVRVWIEAPAPRNTATHASVFPFREEQQYIEAILEMGDGDPSFALSLRHASQPLLRFVAAEAALSLHDAELARASLEETEQSENLLATFELAIVAFENEDFELAGEALSVVLSNASQYWPAQELKYKLARHFGWPRELAESLQARLELRPTCAVYRDAARDADAAGNDADAERYRTLLSSCSLRPILFWEEMAMGRRHSQALKSLQTFLTAHPMDRRALQLAIRAAVLSGQTETAKSLAMQLRSVALNLEAGESLVEDPARMLDSHQAINNDSQFYRAYVAPTVTQAPLPDVDAEISLNQAVLHLDKRGAAVYHRVVTRVMSNAGVAQAGEVSVPPGADIIALRTLKADGAIVDAERSLGKNTISMPSLDPGDSVEVAYLQHYSRAAIEHSPEVLNIALGSSSFATRKAHVVVIEEDSPIQLWWSPGISSSDEKVGRALIRTLEANDVLPRMKEPSAPNYDPGPWVAFLGYDTQEQREAMLRDSLIAAIQVTPLVDSVVREVARNSDGNTVAAVFRYVVDHVEEQAASDSPEFASGTESLASGQGSRVSALMTLLSPLGYRTELALASARGDHEGTEYANWKLRSTPLVRVHDHDGISMWLDPTLEQSSAGSISPQFQGMRAMLLSGSAKPMRAQRATIPRPTNERSVAVGDLTLESDGSLQAHIEVRFGSAQGAAMREALSRLSSAERQTYFEEIASRMLPNVGDVTGKLQNEDDPQAQLTLELTATASVQRRGRNFELGQIIPKLGLTQMYASLDKRNQDLLIDQPMVEESTFRLHLPPGVISEQLPASSSVRTQFGEYETHFSAQGSTVTASRSFDIPPQIVSTADYPDFVTFARVIDRAERDSVTLAVVPEASAATASAGLH